MSQANFPAGMGAREMDPLLADSKIASRSTASDPPEVLCLRDPPFLGDVAPPDFFVDDLTAKILVLFCLVDGLIDLPTPRLFSGGCGANCRFCGGFCDCLALACADARDGRRDILVRVCVLMFLFF